MGYVPTHGKFNKYARVLDRTGLYNYPKDGYDWCDIFYDWLLVEEFGLDVALQMSNQPVHGCGAGCEFSASYYRAADQRSGEPPLGAQVFLGASGSESHTGVVVGYDAAYVLTVEGNTGYSAGYTGGAVLERTYSRGDSRISGYGVPRWSVAGGSEPVVDVSNVWRDAGELEVDGWLGVQSVTAWQEALGTYADGFVSGQDWADWGYVPNLVAVERTREAYGSQLVATVQKVVGADVDGLMGPQTVRCLQAWLSTRLRLRRGRRGPWAQDGYDGTEVYQRGGVVVMLDGGTERRRPCGNVERLRHAPRQRPFGGRGGDLAITMACIVVIVLMALCAWLGMAIATAVRSETTVEASAPAGAMAYDSLAPTYTFDGEIIRWYVLQDPDYGIEYLVNDRGGCHPRLAPTGT